MAQKLVIDPVTRVEGHLRVEVEIDGGVVKEAWVSGRSGRGFETLSLGKDPRDLPQITQRVCGFCAASWSLAASLLLDSLFGVDLPENARILRNLLLGLDFLSTHLFRFYQFSLWDYLDLTPVLNYSGTDSSLLSLKKKVEKMGETQDFFPFKPNLAPDQFVLSDPAMVTSLTSHYFEALLMRKKAHQAMAIFGGRMPGLLSIVPGGVTYLPPADKITPFKSLLKELSEWVVQVFLTDVMALATGPLLPLGQQGLGKGRLNFLSVGAFPRNRGGSQRLFPSGVILEENPAKVQKMDSRKIGEVVKYAWYAEGNGGFPWEARTQYDLRKDQAYSYLKAPRYKGRPMETGPLARLLIKKDPTLTGLTQTYGLSSSGLVAREVARVLEAKIVAEALVDWVHELVENIKRTKTHWVKRPPTPGEGKAVAFLETPAGSLSQFLKVKGGRVSHYQIVAPTTWKASPRDEKDQRGPLEEALLGVPVPDPNNPWNILRVVHSFDLCLSCGSH